MAKKSKKPELPEPDPNQPFIQSLRALHAADRMLGLIIDLLIKQDRDIEVPDKDFNDAMAWSSWMGGIRHFRFARCRLYHM